MKDRIETVRVQGGAEHPTYAGVLAEAHKKGLRGIEVTILQFPKEDNQWMCICSATVRMEEIEGQYKMFTEIGDTSPKNVNKMIVPHLIRMAATRAKGRALRDAVNIGKTLREEMSE
jgi:NACalpha-BTF3-like transcription factor